MPGTEAEDDNKGDDCYEQTDKNTRIIKGVDTINSRADNRDEADEY